MPENTVEKSTEALKIYLDFPDVVQASLINNHITPEYILQQSSLDGHIEYGIFPYQLESGVRTKDIRPVIIATGAVTLSVLSISTAISQVLNTIYQKPYLIELSEIQEVRDANGDIILGEDGKPIYKTEKKYELIEPEPEKQTTALEFELNPENGLLIDVKLANEPICE